MFSLLGYGAGAIYSAFMLLTILWAVALVAIWNDADETYGTGLFWALAVLVAPVFSIPIYWLMRLGTHRSLDEEIAADERLERKAAWERAANATPHGQPIELGAELKGHSH